MESLIEKIALADEMEIEVLLRTILKRYAQLQPNREISILNLNISEDRNEQLDRVVDMLQKMKE